jgi:hypothetical protein
MFNVMDNGYIYFIDDLLEELNNMPTNARLATPTIKSRSMSDLATEDEQLQVCKK